MLFSPPWNFQKADSMAPVICNHCPPLPTHTYGDGRDSGANVWGSDLYLLSSPAVPACGITQIYPHGIDYYKEQGYDSQ